MLKEIRLFFFSLVEFLLPRVISGLKSLSSIVSVNPTRCEIQAARWATKLEKFQELELPPKLLRLRKELRIAPRRQAT